MAQQGEDYGESQWGHAYARFGWSDEEPVWSGWAGGPEKRGDDRGEGRPSATDLKVHGEGWGAQRWDGSTALSQGRHTRKAPGRLDVWLAVFLGATFLNAGVTTVLYLGGRTALRSIGLPGWYADLHSQLGLLLVVAIAFVASRRGPSVRFRAGDRPIPLLQRSLVYRERGGFFWFLVFIGASFVYGGLAVLISGEVAETAITTGSADRWLVGSLALVLGLPLLVVTVWLASTRTVLDATGIHKVVGSTTHVPWPASRTGMFVRVVSEGKYRSGWWWRANVYVVAPNGQAVELDGLERSVSTSSFEDSRTLSLEAEAVAHCSRIWEWAVAHGYTQETHEYVPLSDVTKQEQREEQERRFNLRDRTGSTAAPASLPAPSGAGSRRPSVATVVIIGWIATSYLLGLLSELPVGRKVLEALLSLLLSPLIRLLWQ